MLPLRFLGLLVCLLAAQVWCKPSKSVEGLDYNDDDPPSDYNDDDNADNEDELDAFEEPPQILSTPQIIHVRNGSTIWLPCLLKNADHVAALWLKDDDTLFFDSGPISTDERMIRLPNNTLVIRNVTSSDSSDHYECSILTTPKITITHRVLVDDVPSAATPPHKQTLIYVVPGKRVDVVAGDNVTIGCETKSQPTPQIKWYHENERVRSNVIVSGNSITITKVTRRDAGRYQCLLENGSENPPVEAINVIVNYAPEIETKGKWVHTGLGVESRLTCIVHAHPHATVTWLKDKQEVLPKKGSVEIRSNKTKHYLDILHTEKEHFGNYTCVAENKLGRAEKSIILTGLPSQAIISGGEVSKTSTGLLLKWHLESYSPITEYRLEYRRKGEGNWTTLSPMVQNGNGNTFTVEHIIEGLQPGSYEAILMARNDFGWSPPSKPHSFVGEKDDQQAQQVKESGASKPVLAVATLFLVVSSCAFTSL